MKDICKNCGAWHGLHKWDNDQCPRNGVEASYPKKQEYQNTYYQEDNSDELAALTARVKELEEALIKAESALTYANWDGAFDDNHTAQDVINARDAARAALRGEA